MSDNEETTDINSDDVLKILVATDIHLGYNEKHSLRGKYLDFFYVSVKKTPSKMQ